MSCALRGILQKPEAIDVDSEKKRNWLESLRENFINYAESSSELVFTVEI